MIRLVLGVLIAVAQEERLPVPDPAAQKQTSKTVRDIFKLEFSKKAPVERAALARKLDDQAQQTRDDPTSQYVLWTEARDLFQDLGDVDAALAVISRMGRRFLIDAVALKTSALAARAKTAKTPEEVTALARTGLRIVEEALAADDFDGAAKASEQALSLAKRGKDLPLVTRLQARAKDLAELKGRSDRVKKARDTLADDPRDAAANSVVGRHEWFVRGNWAEGLRHLAKATDDPLHAAALTDQSSPSVPADQLALADAWWAASETEPASARPHLRIRALYWYEQAAPLLGGLAKVKAEQRLGAMRVELLAQGEWVDVTDPQLFGLRGKAGDPVEIVTGKGAGAGANLKDFPKGDFDGLMVRAHVPKGTFGIVTFERDAYAVWLDGRLQEVHVSKRGDDGGFKPYIAAKVAKLEDCLVTVLIAGGHYVVHLDGKEVFKLPTELARFTSLRLDANNGTITYDQIRLRRLQP